MMEAMWNKAEEEMRANTLSRLSIARLLRDKRFKVSEADIDSLFKLKPIYDYELADMRIRDIKCGGRNYDEKDTGCEAARMGIIIVNEKNELLDGIHRLARLRHKYGSGAKVQVLKLL